MTRPIMSQAGRLVSCVSKDGSAEQLLGFAASEDKSVHCWRSLNSANSCFCQGPHIYSLCRRLFCRKSAGSFVGEAKVCPVSKTCHVLMRAPEFSVSENWTYDRGLWKDRALVTGKIR